MLPHGHFGGLTLKANCLASGGASEAVRGAWPWSCGQVPTSILSLSLWASPGPAAGDLQCSLPGAKLPGATGGKRSFILLGSEAYTSQLLTRCTWAF